LCDEPAWRWIDLLFPTVNFAIFFMVVFVVSWLLMPRFILWKLFILAASCFFYALWDWKMLWLLLASAAGNQAMALLIARFETPGPRKVLLGIAVAFNLGLLGWFKFYDFFVSSADNLLRVVGLQAPLPLLQVTLPVGISFLTFRAISYVVDVYRARLEPAPLLDVAVFITFFPYIAAGPIVRGSELLPQLRRPRDPRRIDASRAFRLIFAGLVKKVLIADFLATAVVNGVFATPGRYSALDTLAGIYGYAVQIYCDFSAYTDIAIGVALLLGFALPDNFDAPYTAVSFRDFWRRWHMTLSRFLRDYLYIPLGGNRRGRRRTSINLMITMLLAGLWHGAAWTFVFWGGFHGVGLAWDHRKRDRRRDLGLPEEAPTRRRLLRQRLVTFNLVCLGWVFFRADSFGAAWAVLARLFTGWFAPVVAVTPLLVAVIALGVAIQYVPRRAIDGLQAGFSRLQPVAQGLVLGLGLAVVTVLGPQGAAPFLYFRF